MLKEKKKLRIYLLALSVVLLAAVVLVICFVSAPAKEAAPPAATPRPTQPVLVREKPVSQIIVEKQEITIEEIRSGLNDMGTLLTAEYYFTDVISNSKMKTLDLEPLFSIPLGITESSYVVSYDGVVTAGVDFSAIRLARDEEKNVVTVLMPAAQIVGVDVDPQSFHLYSEKTGLGNPISLSDYNDDLVKLEQTAELKATERGLLDRASENARQIVYNFVSGLVDTARWSIEIKGA